MLAKPQVVQAHYESPEQHVIIHTKTILNSRTLYNYSSFFSIIYRKVH